MTVRAANKGCTTVHRCLQTQKVGGEQVEQRLRQAAISGRRQPSGVGRVQLRKVGEERSHESETEDKDGWDIATN